MVRISAGKWWILKSAQPLDSLYWSLPGSLASIKMAYSCCYIFYFFPLLLSLRSLGSWKEPSKNKFIDHQNYILCSGKSNLYFLSNKHRNISLLSFNCVCLCVCVYVYVYVCDGVLWESFLVFFLSGEKNATLRPSLNWKNLMKWGRHQYFFLSSWGDSII